MKIAIVSKADSTAGGASRVAADLTVEMAKLGHDVRHFAAYSNKRSSQQIEHLYGGPVIRKLTLFSNKAARKLGVSELLPLELPAALLKLKSFDVVHFHDTSSAFSPITLLAVAKLTSAIWTFHDCSPFTGGCIYPQMADCERYMLGCGKCPLKGQWPLDGAIDATAMTLSARRVLHAKGSLSYVAPSDWMADAALASGNVPVRPKVISNMIATEIFKPWASVAQLRRKLGLPLDRLVIAVSAGNLSDPRKNIRQSLETMNHLATCGSRPMVILIGTPDASAAALLSGVDFISTGFVSDRNHLAQWLAASDAFVTTSMADNQPLAIMEAMACGTPVYGWSVGGISEMVKSSVNGRLIPTFDPLQLAEAINKDSESGMLVSMREPTREWAIKHYSSKNFSEKHDALYRELNSARRTK